MLDALFELVTTLHNSIGILPTFSGLLNYSRHDFWVAMALIACTEHANKIQVFLAINVL